jgi:hypothetical protein
MQDNNKLNFIPFSQIERLKFIERQLMWGRAFKARMLMDKFGSSRSQVASDLKLYISLFPKNVDTYNPVVKAYTPSIHFTAGLIALEDDSGVEDSCLTRVPVLSKTIESEILTLILQAVQANQGVELIYGSSTTPLGKRRLIYPVRLLSCVNRLHFRGYCSYRKEYRDFVVSRCLTKPRLKPPMTNLPEDHLWNEEIEINLHVNPSLSKEGQDLIRHDYKAQLEQKFTLPKAMVQYFIIENNIPSTKEQFQLAESKPWSYPLVLERSDEVDNLLFTTG